MELKMEPMLSLCRSEADDSQLSEVLVLIIGKVSQEDVKLRAKNLCILGQ